MRTDNLIIMISNFYKFAKTDEVSQWFSVQEEFISSNKKLNAQMLENIENEKKTIKRPKQNAQSKRSSDRRKRNQVKEE